MQAFFSWLLRIDRPDEDTRRRGRTVVILALSLMVLAAAFVPVVLFQAQVDPKVFALLGVPILLYAVVVALARRGLVAFAGLLFIAIEIISILGSILSTGQVSYTPFFLALAVLAASLTLRPWQIWPVLAITIGGLIVVALLLPQNPFADPTSIQFVLGSMLLLGVTAVMSFLGAKTTSNALSAARQARAEAETYAQALSHTNAELETAIADRTAALQSALAEVQARADAQDRLLAELDQQRRAMRELSVPVIPISAQTLIMPLVGELDTARLAQIQEQALQALQRTAARYLVLDITGVPVVDTQVAQGLVAVVEAARLLGAQVIMVGIRPEVAQSIVGLGLSFQGMRTAADLQSALGQLVLN
jgi:rsbT co-antagonist protein RsbR